jgi:leucine-rich repeat protein SHOC2
MLSMFSLVKIDDLSVASIIIRLYLPNMEIALQRIQLAKDSNATTLSFESLKLFNLPVELFELTSLTELDLSSNKLLNIPKEIGQLSSLTELDLSSNKLLNIPKEIGQLSSLTCLNLCNNQLVSLPKEIGQLSSLTELNLHHNQLLSIPEEIGKLNSLTELFLGENQLVSIPREIGQLRALTALYLYNNQLVRIPKEIGQLSILTILALNFNKLVNIPKEIGQLNSLIVLNLNGNKLANIPKEIGQLSSLISLNLYCNQLLSIPKEIGQLSSLTTLDLSNNQFTSLPIELIQLRQAKISYYNNPIEYIPPNLLRFLQRDRNDYQKVYSDGQNVHNNSIQDGISNSINYIMNQKPILTENQLSDFIINCKHLSVQTKQLLMEYSNNPDIHSRFDLSFSELLLNVFSLIEDQHHDNREAIYSVMNQEMADAQCKCFTGRISRLVNCLNGFDPNIIIQISNSEQIGNIIGLIQRQLETSGTYSIRNHQDLVRKELLERGYDDKVINEWVDAI